MRKDDQLYPGIAIATSVGLLFIASMFGCKSTPSGGVPIDPPPLGSVLDTVNRAQENNAEAAKFIVYTHEFELNAPKHSLPSAENEIRPADRAKVDADGTPQSAGFRLNEYGLVHLESIAKELHNGSTQHVVVEQSQSSKHWDTLHQYPVHYNDQLDEARRLVVVAALRALGVAQADELVTVAAAFPEGLPSQEAVSALRSARFGGSLGNAGGIGGI